MTPTNRLRFVEREVNEPVPHSNRFVYVGKRRILQQWWEESAQFDVITDPLDGEWRDVPIEQEDAK